MKKKANIILAGVIILFFACLTMIIFNAISAVEKISNEAPKTESFTYDE